MISANKSKAVIFSLILSSLFTLTVSAIIFLAGAKLKITELIISIFWTALSVFLLVFKKTSPSKIKSVIASVISIFMTVGLGASILFPSPCNSDNPSFYRFQKTYENIFNYKLSSFPEKIPYKATDYRFVSMSGFMQAKSSADLVFRAEKEYINEIKNGIIKNAVYSIKLNDYISNTNTDEDKEDTYSSLSFNTSLISRLTDEADIYLTSYSNDYRYDYVIISTDGNTIQYGNRGN